VERFPLWDRGFGNLLQKVVAVWGGGDGGEVALGANVWTDGNGDWGKQ